MYVVIVVHDSTRTDHGSDGTVHYSIGIVHDSMLDPTLYIIVPLDLIGRHSHTPIIP